MAVLIKYPCGDELHDIIFTDEGDVIPLDHDIEAEAGAQAIGSKLPPCMEIMFEWAKEPDPSVVNFILEEGILPPRELVKLIIEWAKHVAPLYKLSFRGDDRLDRLLELATLLAEGEATAADREEADEIRGVLSAPGRAVKEGIAHNSVTAGLQAFKAAWWLDYDTMYSEKDEPTGVIAEVTGAGKKVLQHGRIAAKRQEVWGLRAAGVPLEERRERSAIAREAERQWQLARFNEALEQFYGSMG